MKSTPRRDDPSGTEGSRRDDLRAYLTAVFGEDCEGYAHVAVGAAGYFTEAGSYAFTRTAEHTGARWTPRVYPWPTEADRMVDELSRVVDTYDVYVCPYLMRGTTRTPDDALMLRTIHADIDGRCPLDEVAELGAWAVSSGTPGHAHVYLALTEPVSPVWHTALCRGLGTYLGHADAKIRPNDVLRPPGTRNHKGRARGGESMPVEWLIRPSEMQWEPAALAEQLGITLPDEDGTTGGVTDDRGAHTPDEETPFDLDAYPAVRRAFEDLSDPPDRSVDTMKVVAAVYDAGLHLAHARWAVGQRADLTDRLDGRRDDDVATCWGKIALDREATEFAAVGSDTDGCGPLPVPAQARFTDAGLADTVAESVLKGRFLRARGIGWLAWDDTRWRECGDGPPTDAVRLFVLAQIRRYADKLKRDPASADALDGIAAWKKIASAARIVAVLKLAGNLVEIEAGNLDANPDLLNTPTGVVDLRTGDVRSHDPADLMTRITRGSYRPGYTHPDVDAALEALPAAERDWFQRRIGQAITGHMSSDVVLLQGSGENGKSALTTGGLFPALGDYAHVASSRLFSAEKGNDHSTERADLRGRRLVIGEELTEGRSLDVTAIKRITDVDNITARRLYQDNATFKASHTLIVCTNHRPVIDQTDHGTWRRLNLLRFPYTFVKRAEDVQRDTDRLGDPTLKQRIGAGRDGQHDALVTWAVTGALAYHADPAEALQPTTRVAEDTQQWRAETDRILGYWKDRLVADQSSKITVGDLLTDFNFWLASNGHREWAKETFGPRFEEHQQTQQNRVEKRKTRDLDGLSRLNHYARPTGQQWVWVGVRFRRTEDDLAAPVGQSDPCAAEAS